jgi:hypothetical protein
MIPLSTFLPGHLRHLQHSKLFKAIETAVDPFRKNKIVDDEFAEALVMCIATEFEKTCETPPISNRVLELPGDAPILNYRFDRGYWELVFAKSNVIVRDTKSSNVVFKREANMLAIEGSGSGLRRGKRKTESIKRAFSRQIARDSRKHSESESDYEEEGSDEEWVPR